MSFPCSVFGACVENTSTAYLKYSFSHIYYRADASVTSASSDSQLSFQPACYSLIHRAGQHITVTLCLFRDLSFDAALPPVQSAGCLPPLCCCGCRNSGPIPDPLEAWGTPARPLERRALWAAVLTGSRVSGMGPQGGQVSWSENTQWKIMKTHDWFV